MNLLNGTWQIITLERLFHNFFGESLYKSIYQIPDHKERLNFLTSQVERMTGLKDFGAYLNKLFTIDAFFLNEDRHTHNIAVLMNDEKEFSYCPILQRRIYANYLRLLRDIRRMRRTEWRLFFICRWENMAICFIESSNALL